MIRVKKFKRIYVEITNICNKNCSFCSPNIKPKKNMSIFEFTHVLKEIKPYTDYIYLHVKGEPLLHPYLNNILDLCNQYHMKVNITTNGTLLNKVKDILIKYPCIRQINISLHSFNSKDDKNYINNVLNAVEDIKRKQNIIIVYRFWALKNLKLSDSNKKILEKIINYYHLDDRKVQIINENSNIKIAENIYINKHELFDWPTLNSDDIVKTGYCYGLINQLAILCDGTVVPCCLDSDGIINLGNIYQTSLTEILESDRAINILKGFHNHKMIEDLCQKCKFHRMLKRDIINVSRSGAN